MNLLLTSLNSPFLQTRGDLSRGSSNSLPASDDADKEQDQEEEENDFRKACGCYGNTGKAKDGSDQRDYQKHNGVVEHDSKSFLVSSKHFYCQKI
jgi:hypothetical protein